MLKTAIADGKFDLAAVAATALGQVTDRNALSSSGRPHPLVEALYAPGRRVQFAAAKALVTMAPERPFPGSSRVVPTLARFLINQPLPRAVVIDSNPNRGSQLTGFLLDLGYDSELELTGTEGFLAAAASTDVDLILMSYDLFRQGWSVNDTLANLDADARTAAIPIFIYGPLDAQLRHPNLVHDHPRIRFIVHPVDAATLKQQLQGPFAPFGEQEHTAYARDAAAMLARIAEDRKSPIAGSLAAAEPALAVSLNGAENTPTAATALGHLPDPDAQRSLAELVLDPSRSLAVRKEASTQLVRSIERFGALITTEQEARFATRLREEENTDAQSDLSTIFRALRPTTPVSTLPTRSSTSIQPPRRKPMTPSERGAN